VLRYYADLPVGEVAALMGCAPGTVKSLTNRAIRALRAADQQPSIHEVGNDA
jgi:DNA-directed RNA polymerase specialized sigma24 family protein